MTADNRWSRWVAHSEPGRTDGAAIKNKLVSKKSSIIQKKICQGNTWNVENKP
jgi:hypothetical protein